MKTTDRQSLFLHTRLNLQYMGSAITEIRGVVIHLRLSDCLPTITGSVSCGTKIVLCLSSQIDFHFNTIHY
ncbi:hypothetical protein Y032_0012g1723 [Ancylostoma ceylanicum]|uniref:Uncharacterized protein n=1 Tax=Ancylostoma ceylanicum TaxID=53326 RepID=A0A016VCK4_9BILA|nr:hypothetical protein Y032_0012g1723 [Ancylostoma ceylanicum]